MALSILPNRQAKLGRRVIPGHPLCRIFSTSSACAHTVPEHGDRAHGHIVILSLPHPLRGRSLEHHAAAVSAQAVKLHYFAREWRHAHDSTRYGGLGQGIELPIGTLRAGRQGRRESKTPRFPQWSDPPRPPLSQKKGAEPHFAGRTRAWKARGLRCAHRPSACPQPSHTLGLWLESKLSTRPAASFSSSMVCRRLLRSGSRDAQK